MGAQYSRCRLTPEPIPMVEDPNELWWPINFDAEWLCKEDSDCARMLGDEDGVVHKCGRLHDVGIPIERDLPG